MFKVHNQINKYQVYVNTKISVIPEDLLLILNCLIFFKTFCLTFNFMHINSVAYWETVFNFFYQECNFWAFVKGNMVYTGFNKILSGDRKWISN